MDVSIGARVRVLLILAAAGVIPIPFAHAESTPTTQEVLAAEDARFAAMIAGDTAALARILADDLTYVHSSGRVETKDEYLKAVGSQSLRYLAFVPSERRVTLVDASAAIIMGRANVRAVLAGQEQAFDLRYIGVYSRSAAGWQLRGWQTTRIAAPSGK